MPENSSNELPERPPKGAERWILTFFLAGFIGLMGAELLSDYGPRKLSALFFLLFWIPLLAIHEAGHAIAARACGWKVDRIVIGFGQTLKKLKIAKIPVYIKAFPLSGYVLPRPANLKSPRLKSTIIYAAGPGIEAVCVLLLIFIIGPEKIFRLSDSIPLIAAQSFCVAAALGLIFTLVPHKTSSGGGESWSDGMGILYSWRLPDAYFTRQITTSRNSDQT